MRKVLIIFVLMLCVCAQSHKVVVAPVSYEHSTDIPSVIKHQQLREGLIFYLKLQGFAVARDGVFTYTHVDFPYFPTTQLMNIGDNDKILIELLVGEKLVIVIHGGQDNGKIHKIEVPAKTELFLPTIKNIANIISEKCGVDSKKIVPQGKLKRTMFSDNAPLNWGFQQRLAKMNSLLQSIHRDQLDIETLFKLTVLCQLHGCYFWNKSKHNAYKYFGKSLAFAEWLYQRYQNKKTKAIIDELRWLAHRFCGEDEDIDFQPALPSTTTVQRFIELPFKKKYPAIRNLFDLLVHTANLLYIKDATATKQRFIYNNMQTVDAVLVCRKTNPMLARGIFSEPRVSQLAMQEFGSVIHDLGANMENILAQLRQKRYTNPWSLLEHEGAGGKERIVDQFSLELLGIAKIVQELVHTKRIDSSQAFSSDLKLHLLDVHYEICHRFLEIVLQMQEERRVNGHKAKEAFINRLFDRYGRHHIPQRYFAPLMKTKYQKKIADLIEKADRLYYSGQHKKALETARPLLPLFESKTVYLETMWQLWLRSGKNLDEGMKTFAAIWNVPFARDNFRLHMLSWKYNDFSMLNQSYWRAQTYNYADYYSRCEYALRNGNYTQAWQTAKSYHYTGDSKIVFMATMAQLLGNLTGFDRQNSGLWKNLQSHWGQFLVAQDTRHKNFYPQYTQHWLKMFEEECGTNQHWQQVKKELSLEDWAIVNQTEMLLYRAPDREKLHQAYSAMKKITAAQQGKNQLLFDYALKIEHQAFGRWLASTSKDEVQLSDEQIKEITNLVEKSRGYSKNNKSLFRTKSWFLCYMHRFGVPATKIKAVYQQLPQELKLLKKKIAIAFRSGEVLETLLETTIEKKYLPILEFKDIDLEALFTKAYVTGIDDCAMKFALQYCLDEKSLALMVCYLQDNDESRNWIKRNSLDRKTEKQWLQTLAHPPQKAQELISKRTKTQKPLPEKLIDIYEYMNQ